MVLWGRVLLYWNNQTCPNKVALTEHRGSKVWWKRLLPPLRVLCCSLKSSCAFRGWGWKMGLLHPLISGEGNWWPLLFRKPSKKTNGVPSCGLDLHQILALSLSVPGPSAHPVPHFCVLSRAHSWDSKSNLKGLKKTGICFLPPEESVIALCPALLCPRRAVTWLCSFLESLLKNNQNVATKLSALCTHLCPLLLNGCSVVPARSLILERQYTLPNRLHEGEYSFSV